MAELKLVSVYYISIDYCDERLETIKAPAYCYQQRQFMNQVTERASEYK